MTIYGLPLLFALLAGLSDLAAGWLTFRAARGRFWIETRYLIAFASGVLLAVVFFDILPELDVQAHYGYLALGFFTFYVLEKLMMLHACGEEECEVHAIGPVAVVGMALDNVIDGVIVLLLTPGLLPVFGQRLLHPADPDLPR